MPIRKDEKQFRYNELTREAIIKNEDISPITELFDRTMNNCKYYEEKGDTKSLIKEIGVLRGIAYTLEALNEENYYFWDKDFRKYISLASELTR